MKRHRYTQKFKNDAMKLYRLPGAMKQGLAKQLGVSPITLARWNKEQPMPAYEIRQDSVPRSEYDRVLHELDLIKTERDMLRKVLTLYLTGSDSH